MNGIAVDKAREAAARRLAKSKGLLVSKSRWHRGSIDNAGGYRIIDPHYNSIVAGERWQLTIEDVEGILATA